MKHYFFILILLFSLTLVSAEYIYKQNDYVNFRFRCFDVNNSYCSNSTVLLINVEYPDGTNALNNKSLTAQNTYFNVSLPTSQIGTYSAIIVSPTTNGTITEFTYDVTGNGRAEASGGVIVLFSIIFIIVVIFTCFMTLYSFGHLMSLDFDILDFSFDLGVYVGIIALYFVQDYYLGNIAITNYLSILIKIGAFVLVLIPIVALILSITIGTLQNKNVQTIQQPRRIRWRR